MEKSKILALSLVANAALASVSVVWLARRPWTRPEHGSLSKARVELFRELAKMGAHADVVVAGDSLVAFAEWWELLGRPVANRGVAGDTTLDLMARVPDIVALRPRVLFLMVGVNDLQQGASPAELARRYAALLGRLGGLLPGVQIVVQSVLPVRGQSGPGNLGAAIREANALLRQASVASGAAWLDLGARLSDRSGRLDEGYSADGVHLSSSGYRLWSSAMRPYLPEGEPAAKAAE